MRTRISLGGQSDDLDSRRSRSDIINAYFRIAENGEYRDILRAEALDPFIEVGTGPIKGMFAIRGSVYVASGTRFYRVDPLSSSPFYTVTELTDGGGSPVDIDSPTNLGTVEINANGADTNQVLVLTPLGAWVNDSGTDTLTKVIDVDFDPDYSVASLDQTLWFNTPGSNKFFGSAVGDALDYPALRFDLAAQSPDDLRYVAAQRTNLWLMGSKTCEYWQTVTGQSFPLRRVAGATVERGVAAKASVVQFEDRIIWLADDLTVRQIIGSSREAQKISDLDFEQSVRGDGTLRQQGYANPNEAEAFLLELTPRKYYCITFPSNNITWVYDFTTGAWHKRSSGGLRWDARESAVFEENFFNTSTSSIEQKETRLVGSASSGTLYKVNEGTNGNLEPLQIITPPIYDDQSPLFISEVELVCEVGVGLEDNSLPEIIVEYSKNGGLTWQGVPQISFGRRGEYEVRVISRLFGHVKVHSEFCLRYTISDPVYFKAYSLWADIEKGA